MELIGHAVRIRPEHLRAYEALGFSEESSGVIVAMMPPDRVRVDWGGDLGLMSGVLIDRLELV